MSILKVENEDKVPIKKTRKLALFHIIDLIDFSLSRSDFENVLTFDNYWDTIYFIYINFSSAHDEKMFCSSSLSDRLKYFCINYKSGQFSNSLNKVFKIIRFLKEEIKTADVITALDPYLNGVVALILSKALKKKLVLHLNANGHLKYKGTNKLSFPPLRFRWVERLLELIIMQQAAYILADRQHYLESGFVPKWFSTKYVKFGVSVYEGHYKKPCLRNNLKPSLGLIGKKVVLYVGRLARVKYSHDILPCFNNVLSKVKDSVLIIAGEGALKESLIQSARDKNIESKILFLGNCDSDKLVDLYHSADVVIAPHGGYTIVEAALAEKPVVAFDFEWHPEFIEDGETGFLVPFRDFKAMADRTIQILNSPERFNKIGKKAREKALRECSYEGPKKKLISFYDGICNNKDKLVAV